ncbi:MAG: hypothetical protein JWM27_1081 [Gemmatimonadetes bacterium]|nr:hypothetical protein [Gemmatimonadota bacterium]
MQGVPRLEWGGADGFRVSYCSASRHGMHGPSERETGMNGAPPAHRAELALLGLRTTIEADDGALLRAALAGYAAWSGLRPADGDGGPHIRLRLDLGPSSVDSASASEVSVRVDGRRLHLSGAGIDGWADADRCEARCTVPPELAADPARLAAEVTDALLLFLLTRAGRVPVHAAGIVAGDTAVVLAGPSGAGKSTLALAAQRAGLRVLSDDTVYVQLRPRLRVWGFPRPIHVFPADAGTFTEGAAMRLRGGRWKAAVPVDSAGAAPMAERAVLCLLARGPSVRLDPISTDDAARAMDALLEPGFDHFREGLPEAVRALAEGGAWRLTLSANPDEAVDAIRRMPGG